MLEDNSIDVEEIEKYVDSDCILDTDEIIFNEGLDEDDDYYISCPYDEKTKGVDQYFKEERFGDDNTIY